MLAHSSSVRIGADKKNPPRITSRCSWLPNANGVVKSAGPPIRPLFGFAALRADKSAWSRRHPIKVPGCETAVLALSAQGLSPTDSFDTFNTGILQPLW